MLFPYVLGRHVPHKRGRENLYSLELDCIPAGVSEVYLLPEPPRNVFQVTHKVSPTVGDRGGRAAAPPPPRSATPSRQRPAATWWRRADDYERQAHYVSAAHAAVKAHTHAAARLWRGRGPGGSKEGDGEAPRLSPASSAVTTTAAAGGPSAIKGAEAALVSSPDPLECLSQPLLQPAVWHGSRRCGIE